MDKTIIKVADIVDESVVDGNGIRMTIFVQGCIHRCEGCHNSGTWNFDGGYEFTAEALADRIKKNPLLDGFTFSGGEPFEQAAPLGMLAEWAHKSNLNVWSYTGYTLEELLDKATGGDEGVKKLLDEIDVLVDGRFILAQKDLMLKFRGSKNQRIIDMIKTRADGYKKVYLLD